MFVSVMKSILYSVFVDTGILYLLFPVIKRLLFLARPPNGNHQLVDASGSRMNVTNYKGKIFPPVGDSQIASVKNFSIRESDILIAGYPKTGCHWLFEILHMMRNDTLSLSKYGKEFGGMFDVLPGFLLDSLPSPRILNTHFLLDDLPPGIRSKRTKIILTLRCAKDTVVSFYNHNKNLRMLYNYDGKFEDYYKMFMAGELEYGDFFEYYHDWAKVIRSPDTDNEIFLLNFEDLKKDPAMMIKKLARFLHVEMTHQRAVDIAEASSFNNMKKGRASDPFGSAFLRKGTVGDWKNWMDDGQKNEIDRKWKSVEEEYKVILDRQDGVVKS